MHTFYITLQGMFHVSYIATGTERLKYCTMDGVQNFSANFFIPTLMDFEKHFDTFFTLVNGCENLKYDSITKFQWIPKCCHMEDCLLNFSQLSTACEI